MKSHNIEGVASTDVMTHSRQRERCINFEPISIPYELAIESQRSGEINPHTPVVQKGVETT